METKGIAIVLLSVLINTIISEAAVCFDNLTSSYECCQDYKNISGTCKECIGSWGKDCGNNCNYGYYGHGCRKRCNCSYLQKCDPKNGCVEPYQATDSADCTNNKTGERCQNNTDVSANVKGTGNNIVAYSHSIDNQTVVALLAVSGLVIVLLLGTVLYCNRKLKKKIEPFQRCTDHEVNTSEIQDGQDDFIYNDIRESRMIDNGCALSGVYNLPPQICDLTSSIKKDTVMKNLPNQARAALTRSRTVGLDEYGHWYRGSDDYNHIIFNRVKQLSLYSDVMTNDYDIFKSPTTSHETQIKDDECGNKQLKKHSQIDMEASLVTTES
nr:protein draper-like [Crassostrea gigas]